jgi:hypothetical protein
MVWQDIVIAIANILFTLSIANQVYHGFRRKKGFLLLKTSGLFSLGLYAIAISFFSLSLFYSGIVITINASLWLTLFIQRIIYGKV